MSSTSAGRVSDAVPPIVEQFLSRSALLAGAAVFGAAALAWAWLFANRMPADATMAGMAGMAAPEPWSPTYLLAAFAMWALMMVAMMLPSAAPMILLHARIDRGSRSERAANNLLFVLCYVLVWTAFSAVAAVLQAALIAAGLLSPASIALGDRALAAGVLAAAAVYQLSALKAGCLGRCQSPLLFVMRYWRPGAAGAVRLGLAHGLFCLGCCWTLMLLLFVGGVMNLAWVAALAAVVFLEKLLPASWHAERYVAAACVLGAVYLLATG